ncbi:hypothetical protein MJI95_03455, partial [Salmonella enterica subsp. enterica serovar Kentucky]|nr:hypothetical protein [Salmonella enterica subsp. enterica serovar Kentucky]
RWQPQIARGSAGRNDQRITSVLCAVTCQTERTILQIHFVDVIEEMASAYEDPKEVIEFYSKNKELMDNMRNVALEEQAVEAVLAKAKVSEKATSFNELMNQQA